MKNVDDYGDDDDDDEDDDDDDVGGACAVEMHMHGQGKDLFFARESQNYSGHGARRSLCARLRKRSAHGQVRRASLRENFHEKCREHGGPRRLRASLHRSKCAYKQVKKPFFVRDISQKMLWTRSVTQTLCEPAQRKCTWTCQTSHFVQEFLGKYRGSDGALSISL